MRRIELSAGIRLELLIKGGLTKIEVRLASSSKARAIQLPAAKRSSLLV